MDLSAIKKEFVPQYPIPLVEQITKFLADSIIEGRFESGQRLVENELQRKFGVSRAPIRESFRILEKKGLVNITPRKGTFVRKITQKDIEENFPIRACLEGLAARLAISNLEPNDIKRMELTLSRMTEEAKNNNFKSYFKHHNEYHEIFINASRNDTLIEIIENLRRQAVWFRFSYLWHQENFEYAIRVHREILDLFIKKDAERVETLVKEHILIALDRFLQFLVSKNEKGS
jgi:DNA-binding GntR family transcriptional regulator